MRVHIRKFDVSVASAFVLSSAWLLSAVLAGCGSGGASEVDTGTTGPGGAGTGTGGAVTPADTGSPGTGGMAGAPGGTGGAAPTDDGGQVTPGTGGAGGAGGAPVVMGSLKFTRKALHMFNYAEAAGIGDFNKDGRADVHSGPFWWEGPDFGKRHQFYQPPANASLTSGSNQDWANYSTDVDGDGWVDSINIMRPGTRSYWYKNPGMPAVDAEVGTWVKTPIGTLALEQSVFTDFLGTGKPQLVGAIGGRFGWFDVGPNSPWTFTAIAPTGATEGFPWWHGIGVGDLDGDGKQDLITDHAWFTAPQGGPRAGAWVSHPQRFKGDGVADRFGPSDMFGYDVDGDGDQDVITALDSHGYGLAWYENNRGSFTRHVIVGGANSMATNVGMIPPFTQPHAMVLADIDGDGLKDLVAGKSFYAHVPGMGDPDTDGTPVFYVFKLVRAAGSASYVPHLVDSVAGLGRQFTVGELNGDGKIDIAVGSKHGVFVFLQQ